jgi:hypothetical protein
MLLLLLSSDVVAAVLRKTENQFWYTTAIPKLNKKEINKWPIYPRFFACSFLYLTVFYLVSFTRCPLFMLVGVKGKKEMIFMPLQSLGMVRQGDTGPHLLWVGAL